MSEDYTFETRTDPWLPTSDGVTRLTNGGLPNQRTGEHFELRLRDGSVVKAQGTSGADAARNYTNRHPDATVIAWRYYPQHGVFNSHPSQVVG